MPAGGPERTAAAGDTPCAAAARSHPAAIQTQARPSGSTLKGTSHALGRVETPGRELTAQSSDALWLHSPPRSSSDLT